jgi:cyclopropane fatty-acyl-phospholipid synthase-like methyltransferase
MKILFVFIADICCSMPDQINYYNLFGKQYEENILTCPEPELWTTDYYQKGRIYLEIKKRIEKQQELIENYFTNKIAVLDIGCGFGRQAYFLAKTGFQVTGIDTSKVFTNIAKKLFTRHNYTGNFIAGNILTENLISEKYSQIILFDVIEHIQKKERPQLMKKIYSLCSEKATIIISLPHVKERLSSQLNNKVRRRITEHFTYFLNREEHPYPIPGIKELSGYIKDLFAISYFKQSDETDYYVLERI